MLLPLRLLFSITITPGQKVAIGSIFSLGLVIITFSVVRFLRISPFILAGDPHAFIAVALWSMLEAAVGKHSQPPPIFLPPIIFFPTVHHLAILIVC